MPWYSMLMKMPVKDLLIFPPSEHLLHLPSQPDTPTQFIVICRSWPVILPEKSTTVLPINSSTQYPVQFTCRTEGTVKQYRPIVNQ